MDSMGRLWEGYKGDEDVGFGEVRFGRLTRNRAFFILFRFRVRLTYGKTSKLKFAQVSILSAKEQKRVDTDGIVHQIDLHYHGVRIHELGLVSTHKRHRKRQIVIPFRLLCLRWQSTKINPGLIAGINVGKLAVQQSAIQAKTSSGFIEKKIGAASIPSRTQLRLNPSSTT